MPYPFQGKRLPVVRSAGNHVRRVSHEHRLFLTKRTKRRLRSLAIGLITVTVIGVAGLVVIRRERAPARPVTPAEADWAGLAQPLLVAVDRIVNRHDALVAADAPTDRLPLRPSAALLRTAAATLRRLRRLPPAPPRLSAFRSETIDALEDAQRALGDSVTGSRAGDATRLSRADREWAAALGDLAHLDQLVAPTLVPSTIKPAKPLVSFIAYEAALEAGRPQLRAARTIESTFLAAVKAHNVPVGRRLANRSAAVFSALSVQAATLPSGDADIEALNLEYQNSLHHAVLAANEAITALENSNSAQLKRAVKAFATSDATYRRFTRDLSRYGATLTATAATAS